MSAAADAAAAVAATCPPELQGPLLEYLRGHASAELAIMQAVLVTRDIDILGPMAERGLAKVALSVTTLDPSLARTMEPRATTPPRRLDAIRQLVAAGIPTSVMVAPVIPAINDAEIERILAELKEEGAGLAPPATTQGGNQ